MVRICENKSRKAPRERGFADAGRPSNQPGMRQSAIAIGLEQFGFRCGMADQIRRVTGMRSALIGVALGRRVARPRVHLRALARNALGKRARTYDQMSMATSSLGRSASTTIQRSGAAAAISRNALRKV